MSNKKNKLMIFTALFIAITAVTTSVIKIPLPTGGYIHIGDSIIYLASIILPFPLGIVVGGFGGSLADGMAGYYIYIIPTLIVKMINSACFYLIRSKTDKIITLKSIIALAISSIVTIVGYYIVSICLYGVDGSLATIPGNAIQAVGSAIIFVILGLTFDKLKFTARLKLK